MSKPELKKIANQKLARARCIVVLCKRITRKKVKPDFVELIAEHIVTTLPASLMRRLLKGDCGKPMLEAMKLTAPYFA